jgi:heme A synthase
MIKTALPAALVLFAFLGVAEAQSALGGWVPVSGDSSAQINAVSTNAISSGWTLFHIAHCLTTSDAFFIFPLENIGAAYLVTSLPIGYTTITAACQTGNLVAVFVADPSTLTWNQFYTYTFK